MLLFLSKGYFASRNCLREVEAAVRLAGGAYSGGVSGLPGVKAHEVAMASVDPAVDRAQGRIV